MSWAGHEPRSARAADTEPSRRTRSIAFAMFTSKREKEAQMQQTVTLLQVRGVIPSAPADASPAQSCERRFFFEIALLRRVERTTPAALSLAARPPRASPA